MAKNAEGADCITHEWKVRTFRAGLDLFQRCACIGYMCFCASCFEFKGACILHFGAVAAGLSSSGPIPCMPSSRCSHLCAFLPLAAAAARRIAVIAEEEGHHPDLHLTGFNTVTAEMTTHAAKGLTENDFIMATKVCVWVDGSVGGRVGG